MKFQLSIVGDGSYLKELKKIVKSKKLNKFVKFFKKNLQNYYVIFILKMMYLFSQLQVIHMG